MLRPLSRNGLVYALKHKPIRSSNERLFSIELKGISETSTFNGFCAKHDKLLFSPIEDTSFSCSRNQLFMFAYRAIVRETYLKRKQAESLMAPEVYKEIHDIESDLTFSESALLHQAASLQGAEEIERLKSRFDVNLISGDFSRLITTVIEFEKHSYAANTESTASDHDKRTLISFLLKQHSCDSEQSL